MTIINFSEISKSFPHGFKRQLALKNLSLKINQGEVFGFLGPNGAGKSTSIKLLLNFIKPDSGKIFIKDLLVGKDNFQNLIGYLPEIPCFYENLTALEILSFCGRASNIDKKTCKDRSWDVLKKLNLEHAAKWQIRTFSKGMKQRLGIAAALLHDPDIFIFDEPTSGLDPIGRHLITDVILELKDNKKTVFFSTHILSDVERLCDRIGVLDKGHLLFSGEINQILNHGSTLEDAFVQLIKINQGKNNVTN